MRREHDLSTTELASQLLQRKLLDVRRERPARHRDRGGQAHGWRQVQELLIDRAEAFNVFWHIEQNTAVARADIDTETVVAVLIAVVNGCPPLTGARILNLDVLRTSPLPRRVLVSDLRPPAE